MLSVQVLRAVAAMSVVAVHFEYVRNALTGRISQPLQLYSLSAGVDLFFVISGFIMVYSSEQLFCTSRGWLTFLTRRLSRIVPLYWLATCAALAIMSPPQTWDTITKSFLFIPYRTDTTYFPAHAGGWTLNFEMFFYCVFSIALFLPRNIAVPAVGLALTSLVVLGQIAPISWAPISFWSDPIILEFVAGMTIALLHQQYSVRLSTAVRLSLIVLGVALLWVSAPPALSSNRWFVWGLPTAFIFAGTVLGRDIDLWRLFSNSSLFFSTA